MAQLTQGADGYTYLENKVDDPIYTRPRTFLISAEKDKDDAV